MLNMSLYGTLLFGISWSAEVMQKRDMSIYHFLACKIILRQFVLKGSMINMAPSSTTTHAIHHWKFVQ